MPSLLPALRDGAEPDMELRAYRVVCVLTAALLPVFGYVYRWVDPAFYDPLWMRWSLSALSLALGVGTVVAPWVRRHIETLGCLFVYVIVGWFAAIAAVNGLAPEYAVGYLLVLMMIGVANLGIDLLRVTVLCVVFAVAAGAAVAFALPNPGVDPWIFTACVAAGGVAISVSTWVRLGIRRHLRTSEARYRTVFESTTDGIALVDAASLTFLHANEAYLTLTGYTLDELRERTLYAATVGGRLAVDALVREVEQHGSLTGREQQHRRKDGPPIPLEIGLNRIDEGEVPVLCLTAHDLTEQRRIRDELKASKDRAEEVLRLKSSFLQNMSHELRTPLVSILGFAELLAEEPDDGVREMGATIYRSAQRLHDTMNSVLDLAQLEGNGVAYQPEAVNVGAEAERIAQPFRAAAEAKGLALRVKLIPDAEALVDRAAFGRILSVLLSNAVKFTQDGGIGLDVEADSHRVVVRVSDTGVGISEDFLPHLFDEFQQESTGMGRSYDGNGLGLAITKRLVDMMGGRIMVKSVVGEGTVFAVAFGRSWTGPPSGDGLPAGAGATSVLTARPRVLVVEDNADTRRLVERTIAEYYDVETAADAETALALAQHAWFDLLLLDVNLGPGPGGVDLLRSLRAIPAYAYVPALAVTAYALPGDHRRLLEAGFSGYLSKPFTRDELLYALDGVFAGPSDTLAGDGFGDVGMTARP
ncbi:MAG: ATP-binding protein [Rhodothermales bacterium]